VLDDDDSGDADEDADVPIAPAPASVERLPDFQGWELYKVIDDGEEIRTVAIRPVAGAPARSVEFAIFHGADEDPVETGRCDDVADAPLDDAARANLLVRVLGENDPDFEGYGAKLVFAFASSRADRDDAEDEEG
jgi:hypothetical protein